MKRMNTAEEALTWVLKLLVEDKLTTRDMVDEVIAALDRVSP